MCLRPSSSSRAEGYVSWLYLADSFAHSFGSRQVLKAASLWAAEGRITVLFGRNGCGKSTLLKASVGLVRADQGVVHFAGRAYLRPRLAELAAHGLFYLPDRELLSRRLTLREQLRAVEWRFGSSRTKQVLERLGIGGLLDQTALEISGGERRRAELAMAWIRNPRCLLADEPFAGINPSDIEVVAAALRELARDGCAIVVTGHEVRPMMSEADEVVWMAAGTTHGLGSPDGAMRQDQFRREYLGVGR
jgi:lipopolysaccharide export system ATP-binding protein